MSSSQQKYLNQTLTEQGKFLPNIRLRNHANQLKRLDRLLAKPSTRRIVALSGEPDASLSLCISSIVACHYYVSVGSWKADDNCVFFSSMFLHYMAKINKHLRKTGFSLLPLTEHQSTERYLSTDVVLGAGKLTAGKKFM